MDVIDEMVCGVLNGLKSVHGIFVPCIRLGLLVLRSKSQESALDPRETEIAFGVIDRLRNAISYFSIMGIDEDRLSRAMSLDDGEANGFFVHDCLVLYCE